MKKPADSCSGGSRTSGDRSRDCWVCGVRRNKPCPFRRVFGPFSDTPESWREQYRAARAKMLGRE